MAQALPRSDTRSPQRTTLRKCILRIKTTLSRYPFLYGPCIKYWRLGKFSLLRFRWNMSAATTYSAWQPALDTTLWVSPAQIVYSALQESSIYAFNGRIMAGDWDLLQKPFADLDIYIAFRQVFLEGKRWPDTLFYQRILARLNQGEMLWDCRSNHDLQERCHRLELLYRDIKEHGYRSQEELLQASGEYDPSRLRDEVTLGIGRYGDLLFCNSAHRLAIAKLLNVQTIPAKVSLYHPAWIELRRELFLYARELGGRLYQKAAHPALTDIPAIHECDNRFHTIRQILSARSGRLLDIGANIGYFCHRFEAEHFECYAAEDNERELYFLRKLRRASNRTFSIISTSILDQPPILELRFDVVLALNILHHFLKTESDHAKLVRLLRKLRFKEMYFEPHLPQEDQMAGAYRNYTPEEFVVFILENTGLQRSAIIGRDSDGRSIYKIM